MKKQILFTMLLAMFAVASWAQDHTLVTEVLKPSESVDTPENVYVLKNGHFRRMMATTGATESLYNIGLFAFYSVDCSEDGFPDLEKIENAYKIYDVTSRKWLSYDKAEKGGYYACTNFVKLVDDRKDAGYWCVEFTDEFPGIDGKFYLIRPYNSNNAENVSDDGYTYYDGIVSTKYMNWMGSKNNYPNDNPNVTVGLSVNFDVTTVGACWTLETPGTQYIESVIAEDKAWVNVVKSRIGEQMGQYYYTTDEAAFNALSEQVWNATDVFSVLEAAKAHRRAISLQGMREGYFYCFKNISSSEYVGMGTVYLGRMLHRKELYNIKLNDQGQVESDTYKEEYNPVVIWKYEKNGNDYCLRNVYSGLYPQEMNSSSTTLVGTSKSQSFSYALDGISEDGSVVTWNIYIGNKRVSRGDNGIVCQGLGDKSRYSIIEVAGPERSFDTECIHRYQINPKAPHEDVPAGIVLEENVDEYILPSGLADPKKINDCVNNVNLDPNSSDVSQERIWKMFEAILNYNTVGSPYAKYVKDNGSLGENTVIYTPTAEWGTICVPTAWRKINGWTRYNCASLEKDGSLRIIEDKRAPNQAAANTPYIVKIDPSYLNKKYQFIYFEKDYPTVNPKEGDGWLVGALGFESLQEVEQTNEQKEQKGKMYYVPQSDDLNDRYVLAKQNSTGKVGFHLVKTTKLTIGQYKCYLEIPKEVNAARYSFLFFKEDGDVETGIDNVLDTDVVQDDKQGNKQNGKIYNMSGQRLNRMQKGLNIVNGKIVIK